MGRPNEDQIPAPGQRPDWALWLGLAGAEAWQLAYLSMDREPDPLEVSGNTPEMHQRLFTLRKHADRGALDLRAPEGYEDGRDSDSPFRVFTLDSFVAWAVRLRWELPAELRELAPAEACSPGAAGMAATEPQADRAAPAGSVAAGGSDPDEPGLDPSDLPDELDVARQAFRAVSNGYGGSGTFRNRLLAWLVKHRSDLGSEARARIATVANPDKTPGRKPAASE